MGTQYEHLSLENINNGAVPELFELAWRQVLNDVVDLQKPAEGERTVTIEIKVKPDKDRGFGSLKVGVKSKLPAPIPSAGFVHFSIDDGHVASYVNNPTQDVLNFGAEKRENGQNA